MFSIMKTIKFLITLLTVCVSTSIYADSGQQHCILIRHGDGMSSVDVNVTGSTTKMDGSMLKTDFDRLVSLDKGQIQFCYERELLHVSKFEGNILFQTKINSNGNAVESKIISSTLKNKNTEQCELDVFNRLSFNSAHIAYHGNGDSTALYLLTLNTPCDVEKKP
jgi:hypothetical protein